LCTKAPAECPSIWATTTAATLAVVDIKPADTPAMGAPAGPLVMVPKAELNGDKKAHAASITRVAEVYCAAANTSVLITGDYQGILAVRPAMHAHHAHSAYNACTVASAQDVAAPALL
jgi:hypothetical protein